MPAELLLQTAVQSIFLLVARVIGQDTGVGVCPIRKLILGLRIRRYFVRLPLKTSTGRLTYGVARYG